MKKTSRATMKRDDKQVRCEKEEENNKTSSSSSRRATSTLEKSSWKSSSSQSLCRARVVTPVHVSFFFLTRDDDDVVFRPRKSKKERLKIETLNILVGKNFLFPKLLSLLGKRRIARSNARARSERRSVKKNDGTASTRTTRFFDDDSDARPTDQNIRFAPRLDRRRVFSSAR